VDFVAPDDHLGHIPVQSNAQLESRYLNLEDDVGEKEPLTTMIEEVPNENSDSVGSNEELATKMKDVAGWIKTGEFGNFGEDLQEEASENQKSEVCLYPFG